MANVVDVEDVEGARERLLGGAEAEAGNSTSKKGWFCGRITGWCNEFKGMVSDLYAMGKSDPRKIVFALKVGFSLAFVATIIFWFESGDKYSIWAILTVVVVFEFSVGATFSKGFNRGVGTLSAGGLALGIAEISERSSGFEEPVIVASIFWAGFFASYIKLFPSNKSYEYGFRVFLLTFCLVLITGNTSSNFFQTASARLLQIGIGAGTAFSVNVFIFPIWAGEDLHKLVVKNFRGVATSLEGCVERYLLGKAYPIIPSTILTFQAHDDPLYVGYRAAVQSYSKEESLLECAKWEPPHGHYRMFKYPWQNYFKVSGALRHCAFMVMAMHGCILSEIQAPLDKRNVFATELQRVCTAGARLLRELGDKIERMEKLNPSDNILKEVHEAAEELQMKIDQKSYLLVNVNRWEEGKRPKRNEDQEYRSNNNDIEGYPFTNSMSEMGFISVVPEEEEEGRGEEEVTTIWNETRPSIISIAQLESEMGSMLQIPPTASVTGMRWPSLHSIVDNEQEARTAASASSLSLATFTSLLIEFVARLDNVVGSFNELSDLAKFKDQGGLPVSKASCWKTLLMCFQFKK